MFGKIKAVLLGLWTQSAAQPVPVLIPVETPRRRDRNARPRGVFSNKYKFQNHL